MNKKPMIPMDALSSTPDSMAVIVIRAEKWEPFEHRGKQCLRLYIPARRLSDTELDFLAALFPNLSDNARELLAMETLFSSIVRD